MEVTLHVGNSRWTLWLLSSCCHRSIPLPRRASMSASFTALRATVQTFTQPVSTCVGSAMSWANHFDHPYSLSFCLSGSNTTLRVADPYLFLFASSSRVETIPGVWSCHGLHCPSYYSLALYSRCTEEPSKLSSLPQFLFLSVLRI